MVENSRDNAILAIAEQLTIGLSNLGLRNASTPMGAIELLSFEIKEGSERIANGLHAIANAILEHRREV